MIFKIFASGAPFCCSLLLHLFITQNVILTFSNYSGGWWWGPPPPSHKILPCPPSTKKGPCPSPKEFPPTHAGGGKVISPWNVSCFTKISSFSSRHPPTQIALKKTRSYYPRVVPPNRLGYPISCEFFLRFPIPFFTCQNQVGGGRSRSMKLNHVAGGALF